MQMKTNICCPVPSSVSFRDAISSDIFSIYIDLILDVVNISRSLNYIIASREHQGNTELIPLIFTYDAVTCIC